MGRAPVQRHSPGDIAAFAGAVLAGAWLLTQCYVWFYFAGQAGSPQPDNWNAMRAVLDVIEAGLLPALAMCVLGPLAVFAAKKRWLLLGWLHLLVGVSFCAGQYALCLDAWSNPPGNHVAVRLVSREPVRLLGNTAGALSPGMCWPRGDSPLPMDVGALRLDVGDLARIQSIPDVYFDVASNPAPVNGGMTPAV